MRKLLKPREAAERLGVTTETLRRYVGNGWLAAQATAGGQYRYYEDSVLSFVRPVPPDPNIGHEHEGDLCACLDGVAR